MLLIPIPAYQPYEILKFDKQAIIVKADPSVLKPSLVLNSPLSPTGTISFTANYSWKRKPIGYAMNNEVFVNSILNPKYDYIRPCACFNSSYKPFMVVGKKVNQRKKSNLNLRVVIQAGPTLIFNGKISIQTKKEKFRADVARKTRQLSIGITSKQKLIIMYSYAWKLEQIAQQLKKLDCVYAIKLDGGNMASFRLRPPSSDTKSPHIYVGNHGSLPIQISFAPIPTFLIKPRLEPTLWNIPTFTSPEILQILNNPLQ